MGVCGLVGLPSNLSAVTPLSIRVSFWPEQSTCGLTRLWGIVSLVYLWSLVVTYLTWCTRRAKLGYHRGLGQLSNNVVSKSGTAKITVISERWPYSIFHLQWDTRSGEIVQEYDRHLGAVNTITFVDENRRFVTTSDDKSLRVWEW